MAALDAGMVIAVAIFREGACQAQAQLWWKVIKWLRGYLLDEQSAGAL